MSKGRIIAIGSVTIAVIVVLEATVFSSKQEIARAYSKVKIPAGITLISKVYQHSQALCFDACLETGWGYDYQTTLSRHLTFTSLEKAFTDAGFNVDDSIVTDAVTGNPSVMPESVFTTDLGSVSFTVNVNPTNPIEQLQPVSGVSIWGIYNAK